MKKLLSALPPVLILFLLFSMPFLSDYVKDSVKSGIEICLSSLVPSLFPFLFLSSLASSFASPLLTRLFAPLFCPLFGITPPSVSAVISGLLGGFPSGSAESARLYSEKKISKAEAERLPLFCNNAGLMFVIGTVGAEHFSSFKAGLILYFFHIFSSVVCGILTRDSKNISSYTKESASYVPLSQFPSLFTSAVRNSVFSMALISGNFMVFRVFTALLCGIFGNSIIISFISGLFEVTGGILSMPENTTGLILSAFLLSFNGFCVHMQALTFFSPLGLSMKKCIAGKSFSAVLTAFLMYVALPENFFPEKTLPPMVFYIIIILIPLLLLIPHAKKASDTV